MSVGASGLALASTSEVLLHSNKQTTNLTTTCHRDNTPSSQEPNKPSSHSPKTPPSHILFPEKLAKTKSGPLVPRSTFVCLKSPSPDESTSTHCDGCVNLVNSPSASKLPSLHARRACLQRLILSELLDFTLYHIPPLVSSKTTSGVNHLPLNQHKHITADLQWHQPWPIKPPR